MMRIVVLLFCLGLAAPVVAQAPCPYTEPSKCGPTPTPTPTPTSTWPPVPVQPTAFHNKLLFVLYTYEGNTPAFALDVKAKVSAFYAAPSFKGFWEQNSYGYQLIDNGPVLGPYTLHRPAGAVGCLYMPNMELNALIQASIPAGTNEIIYLHPCSSVGERGFFRYATGFVLEVTHMGGYANQYQGQRFLMPWTGQGLICTLAGVLVPLSKSCTTTWHTGDPFATKGGAHTDAGDKFLHWLTMANRTVTTTIGTFHLAPLELFTAAPVFLVLQIPGEAQYLVEYRLPIGPDAQFAGTGVVNAVLLRQMTSVGWAQIDMHPLNTTSKFHQGMKVGETLTLPNTGTQITLQAADANGADVSVH